MDKIAKVLVDLSLNKHFDYLVPPHLLQSVSIGSHVIVPFKSRSIEGFVVSFPASTLYRDKLKEIYSLCDKTPTIPKNLIELGAWMASYYCCSKEHAIRSLLPGAVRSGRISKKSILYIYIIDTQKATEFLFHSKSKSEAQKEVIKTLLQRPDMPLSTLKKIAGVSDSAVTSLMKKNIIGNKINITY